MYFLNPEIVCDYNILAAIWKYAARLKAIYTKFDRDNNNGYYAEQEQMIIDRMIGSFDQYMIHQVLFLFILDHYRIFSPNVIWKRLIQLVL